MISKLMKHLLLILTTLFFTLSALAAERHALVIGNTHYPENGLLVTPLDNCIPDARLIASTLQSLGFKVTLVEDATKSAMDDALLAWEEKLPKGCDALVYFAGHGIEHNGRNYLLGTNARLKAQSRIGEEALEAETVAQAMLLSGAKSSLLFLDCCREAPPAEWVTRGIKKRGLADVKINGDIIIAYAAKPGDSALDTPTISGTDVTLAHGPYAQAVDRFLRSGLKHTDFFQQVRREVARLTGGQQRTWENGSFLDEFYFSPPTSSPVAPAPMPAPAPAVVTADPFAGTFAGQAWENSKGTPFRWCPPGEFWMGSSEEDKKTFARDDVTTDDETRHKVKLTRGFWLSQNEVTQGEWETVMGTTLKDQARKMLQDDTLYDIDGKITTLRDLKGAKRDDDPANQIAIESPSLPIYFVSWDEAVEYCRKLTDKERSAGKIPAGWRYSLPTEAQWEYACRADTETTLYSGGMTIKGKTNAPALDAIAWYGGNSSEGYSGRGWDTKVWPEKQYPGGVAGPRRVGQKKANAWGLHDMIGNLYEWCADWYAADIFSSVADPKGPSSGIVRVIRGGSWDCLAAYCRAAHRCSHEPGDRSNSGLGFRPALVPSTP
ncbi:SUMF1/EgtB/PvdO family nonheme iron enzyme [Prosthecobacter sp.]|uniref:SUMF1/EgtB/PvdO family nonheme iron enzyme n=1 Tax=Prosthecobacter sp. TaxID=1965333 RepID=UPI003785050B